MHFFGTVSHIVCEIAFALKQALNQVFAMGREGGGLKQKLKLFWLKNMLQFDGVLNKLVKLKHITKRGLLGAKLKPQQGDFCVFSEKVDFNAICDKFFK